MYLAELKNEGVSFFYLARDKGRRVVGFCSFWRVLDELHINNLAVLPEFRRHGRRVGAAEARAGRRLRGLACAARCSRCGSRTCRRGSCTRSSGSWSPAREASYYTNPIEDALVLWREEPACNDLETSGGLVLRSPYSRSGPMPPHTPNQRSGPITKEAEHE